MKKILILGVRGMAGHIMAETLDKYPNHRVLGIARDEGRYVSKILDVANFSLLQAYIDEVKPDFVINCVGVLVQNSREDVANAVLINSYLPHFLSKLGEKNSYKFVHISTDCVFSGRTGGYVESAFRDGNDNYARSKALGEVINDKDLTIRTSIIGPELKTPGTGLLDWFLRQEGEVKGYDRAYWSGVTTLELAAAVAELIEQDICGLYHLCPRKKISKYELLLLCANVWDKNVKIVPFSDYEVDKSLVCTRKDFDYPSLEYRKMLVQLKEWMDSHSNYYSYI